MSRKKAFFSTLPGIISALAGLVTVIVGVLAIAAQLGWLSDDDDDDVATDGNATTTTTTASGAAGSGGGATTTAVAVSLSVTPRTVSFAPLAAMKQTVTVRNDGAAPVTLRPPEITGTNRDQFEATTTECRSSLGPGRSCTVDITFAPARPGQYTARLVMAPTGGGRAVEVPIDGSRLV